MKNFSDKFTFFFFLILSFNFGLKAIYVQLILSTWDSTW